MKRTKQKEQNKKKKPVVACLNNQKQLEEKLAAKQAPAGAAPSLEMTR